MILSMTGYGKAVATFNEKKISVEIKSLNSKALDLSTRVAPLYREKEMEIRQMIQQKVIRGKVDFAIWIEKDAATEAAPINIALIENYYNQLQNVAKRLGLSCQEVNGGNIASDWMKVLMRMPDVMSRQEIEELSDEEWTVVRQAIDDALCALVDFRKQEGAALEKKFNETIDNIEALMLSIAPYENAGE